MADPVKSFELRNVWAKRKPREGEPRCTHSLENHSIDVAACAEALLDHPSIGNRLAKLACRDELPQPWKARLAVLSFLHDFGKANIGFQNQKAGHIQEASYIGFRSRLLAQAGLHLTEGWSQASPQFLVSVILAHHGEPPRRTADTLPYGRYWPDDTLDNVAALVGRSQEIWPEAFVDSGEPMPPPNSPFWHGFLGLLQLADWLGSDDRDDAFPFANEGESCRITFARERAHGLLRSTGLIAAPLRAALAAKTVTFSSIANLEPSAFQLSTAEIPGPLVILEADTGSGKTEAALWRFAKLFSDGKVDGLYFALPTRVAASQIHGRVQAAMQKMFGAEAPEVLQALPGEVKADGAGLRLLPHFQVQWNDDADEMHRRSRWAAENPKRFLAAMVAVGTIDQALLGAVAMKHAQMRSFCLSRSLLVVDEVHASDRYMHHLLLNLLEQHRRAGGEALLLSATLGAQARTELLLGDVQSARKQQLSAELAEAVPYPALSWVADGKVHHVHKLGRGLEKTVQIETHSWIAEPSKISAMALAAADAGAKVLVIRNTVKDAVATMRALLALAPEHPALFKLDGVPTLHHSRFARSDRRRMDDAAERQLGKLRKPGPIIIVGTQTLEQSLDIDADLLISDLAPMDVLLQRIGRLHRHQRIDRPKGFQQARTVVLSPVNFDVVLAAREMQGPHGLGTVYRNLLSLAATDAIIRRNPVWRIPAMNRQLVEGATHADHLEVLAETLAQNDERWRTAGIAKDGRVFAETASARAVMLDWHDPVSEFAEKENASTRLGGRDYEACFVTPMAGPFPMSPPVTRLLIPSHLLSAGEQPEPTDILASATGFGFRLGKTAFHYGPMGLERIATI